LAGLTFIDNQDLCIVGHSQLGAITVALMQHLVMQWEGLLVATEGPFSEKMFLVLVGVIAVQWSMEVLHPIPDTGHSSGEGHPRSEQNYQ